MIMTTLQPKKYFGIVGSNKATVERIYNCFSSKICSKTITSLDDINNSLDAIAYVMDCQSDVHRYNLEHIHRNYPKKSLYVVSNQVSIPMLHHAIKMRVRDVLKMPINNKAINNLAAELNESTNIECYEHTIIPNNYIPSTEEIVSHPLEDLFEIIESHYVDAPSLQQVSTRLNLSPSRISHMFKDLCGIGYCQYILCRRLEESEYLLVEENASITYVSFHVGFSNPSHFCRSFKEHIGLTPSAYIKNELGIELSCLYQRYQKLRMELLPASEVNHNQLNRSAKFVSGR